MNLFDLSAVLTLDTSQYEKGISSARQTAQGFEKSTNGINGALNKAQQGFTVFKGVLSNVATTGVNMLANAITSNLGGAIARVDTINNYSTVMKNLGHGAKESQKAIDELVEGIDGLPTTLDGIVTVQQQFAALGGKMEDATKLTIALNNATLAGGQGQEKANGAMQQWYQMIAAGKSDMMSMRIINEAMPAQMDAIAKSVAGADANWQDLHALWQKDPEITGKVKDAILKLNEEGINGTAGFAQQAQDATKGIQTSMQNLQTAIKNGIANIIQEFGKDNIANAFNGLKEGVKTAFGEITEFIQNAKKFGIGEAIGKEISDAKTKVREAFTKLMDIDWASVFSTAFEKAGEIFKQAFDIALDLENLKTDITTRIMEVASEMIMGFITGITENGPKMAASAITVIANFQAGLVNNATKLVTAAVNVINKLVDYLSNNSDKVAKSAVKMVIALGKGLVKNAPRIISSAFRLAGAIITGILKLLPKLPSAAVKIVSSLAKAIWSKRGEFLNIGLDIVKGIGNGITSGVGWIKNKISSFVGNVKSFLKRLFGISSPSKWARDVIGFNIDKGLALGIEGNAGMVDDAMKDLMPDFDTTIHTNGNGRFVSMSINSPITVNGAEDPTAWATSFVDALEMKARAI